MEDGEWGVGLAGSVDLSADLGEATGEEAIEVERQIFRYISSANIACGGHTGDEASMRSALALASSHGVIAGAHPSYPDRVHFGRVSISMTGTALRKSIREQIASLRHMARLEGMEISHVKPHGALYNDAHHREEIAAAIVGAIVEEGAGASLVVAAGSMVQRLAREEGVCTILEAFADRRYRTDGSLVPRSERNALLLENDEASAQVLRLARTQSVLSWPGDQVITVPFATICLHADMDGALERVASIRNALHDAGFEVSASARALAR